MAIKLPSFEDTFCRMGTVCASVTNGSSASLSQAPIDLTASYVAHSGKALARLLWNRAKNSHLHVDFALRAAFAEKPPQPNSSITAFRKAIKNFYGLSVKASLLGYFKIPLSSLPSAGGLVFVGKSGIKLRANQSEIELTGASLVFRNADLDKVRWDLGKDYVFLEVAANRELAIDDSYLSNALRLLDTAVGRYFLGKAEETDGI